MLVGIKKADMHEWIRIVCVLLLVCPVRAGGGCSRSVRGFFWPSDRAEEMRNNRSSTQLLISPLTLISLQQGVKCFRFVHSALDENP